MGQFVVKPISITQFVGRLETEKGFSFARYGDGTFLCLRGKRGWNCDGSIINGDQAEEIEKSILDGNITHGMGDLSLTVGGAVEWLKSRQIDIEWYDCNVMHTASHTGGLYPFVELLRKRSIIFLGAKHLRKFKGFPYHQFIEVHPTEAFYQVDHLETVAKKMVEKHGADTVLISAGTAAPVLVSRLHREFPEINVIDTGSVWDPYVGKLSRKIFRELGHARMRALGKLNFKEDVGKWGAN